MDKSVRLWYIFFQSPLHAIGWEKTMRVGQITVGIALAWALATGSAGAQGFDQVLSSKHNLLADGPASPMDSVCGSCHIEGGQTQTSAAWDKENPTKVFPLQHLPPPDPGKGDPETKPFGPSFDCLACHDGVLGNNVHQLGFSGGAPTADPDAVKALQTGLRTPDHPDSITYPRQPDGRMSGDRADPRLKRYWSIPDRDENGVTVPTGPKSAALNLQNIDPNDPAAASALVRTFMGVIHCDTCHNPHNNDTRPFLRVPHKTLCLVCHDR
ncbi:MAG: cytochrome c3 family protein [Nitrospirae bacterium]|nr:cytochrome c3 family protein [Nitrospirota bacterium]